MERASRDTPRFKNELDAVVFICKQLWMLAFNKQIDNLKTNHQVRGSRGRGPGTSEVYSLAAVLQYVSSEASGSVWPTILDSQ